MHIYRLKGKVSIRLNIDPSKEGGGLSERGKVLESVDINLIIVLQST